MWTRCACAWSSQPHAEHASLWRYTTGARVNMPTYLFDHSPLREPARWFGVSVTYQRLCFEEVAELVKVLEGARDALFRGISIRSRPRWHVVDRLPLRERGQSIGSYLILFRRWTTVTRATRSRCRAPRPESMPSSAWRAGECCRPCWPGGGGIPNARGFLFARSCIPVAVGRQPRPGERGSPIAGSIRKREPSERSDGCFAPELPLYPGVLPGSRWR